MLKALKFISNWHHEPNFYHLLSWSNFTETCELVTTCYQVQEIVVWYGIVTELFNVNELHYLVLALELVHMVVLMAEKEPRRSAKWIVHIRILI